jgi:hypothetical protein
MVSGETISESELQLFINSPNINSPNAGKASRFSTVVRWYPGMQMYRLLNSVSRRGIDDVRRLLLAAGNEKEDLDMVISVSKLLARSTL